MLAKQYMVNVSLPFTEFVTLGSSAEEWHWKHWADPKVGSLLGFGPTPYRILPRSSEAVSVYRGGLNIPPYWEASHFELNPLTSPVAWYSATPAQKIV